MEAFWGVPRRGGTGRSCPFIPHPDPRVRLRQAMHPELCQSGQGPVTLAGTCPLVLCPACLPWQVSAFSHQLLETWALECCSQAPWPPSTWRFTHPFLNLILCPFHSSSHAVFTKISLPCQTKHETKVPWTAWGVFQQLGELPGQRTLGATHSRGKDPNLHLRDGGCSQGKKPTRRCLRKRSFSFGI